MSLLLVVVQQLLGWVTGLLSPAYLLLSVVAVASRHVGKLSKIAAHGKTLSSSVRQQSSVVSSGKSVSNSIQSASSVKNDSCWWLVSKRGFVHFYVMGLCSLAAVAFVARRQHSMNDEDERIHSLSSISDLAILVAARILLTIHLCRRTYECLYVQQFSSTSSKMHICGYALGMGYYLVLPLVFWDIRTVDDVTVDGEAISTTRIRESEATISSSASSLPAILLLIVLNLWMQYQQYQHHSILARLRHGRSKKDDGDNPNSNTSTHALPPKQRWFRYILCPHYLAEILLYVSFALLLEWQYEGDNTIHNLQQQQELDSVYEKEWKRTLETLFGGTTDGTDNSTTATTILVALHSWRRYRHWMLLVWVATNLTVSALNSLDWYQAKFPNKAEGRSGRDDEQSTAWFRPTSVDGRKALVPCIL